MLLKLLSSNASYQHTSIEVYYPNQPFFFRMKYLRQAENRLNTDGLTGLDKLNYKIIQRENRTLYTWLLVDLNSTSVVKHIEGVLTSKRGRIQ